MPLVLTQLGESAPNKYGDVEGALYHFPERRYLRTVKQSLEEYGDYRFIYHRPNDHAPEGQAKTYFGHGHILDWFEDDGHPGEYWLTLQFTPFARPVPLRTPAGLFFETMSEDQPSFQSSVRYIGSDAYHSIVSAGAGISFMPGPPSVGSTDYVPSTVAPDPLRMIESVPLGGGYKPRPGVSLDVAAIAVLQERARADHQAVLNLILERVRDLGGQCHVSNSIDMLVDVGDSRLLVEAKSLVQPNAAIHRMRYGIGQLLDYRNLYKYETSGAIPVLAFGTKPKPEYGRIGDVLEDNRIALIARVDDSIVPGNALGESLPIF